MKNNPDHIDFNFSRSIDFQKNFFLKEFDNLLKLIIKEDLGLFSKHLRVLLIELYFCWCESENQFLKVSMSKRGYKANSRYNPNQISSLIIKVIKHLKSQGLIEYFQGFYDSKRKISRLTRIRASKFLQDEFKKIKINTLHEIYHKDRENIFLIGKDKVLLEYSDSVETHEIRNSLKSYNNLVLKTLFDIVCIEQNFVVRGDNRKIIISEICKNNDIHFLMSLENLWKFSGSWWNKLDFSSINKYIKYMLINDSDTSYVELSEILNLFLTKEFNIIISERAFDSQNFFKNNDQKNYFKIKAISSRNFESFFRAFSNDRKKIGFDEKFSKLDLEKVVNKMFEQDPVLSSLFFKGKLADWSSFISKVFYNLIKNLVSARIPVFLVGDRILFPTVMEKIVLDKILEVLEKKFDFVKIKLKVNQCFKKNIKKEKFFFSRFSKNNLKYSSRYEMNLKKHKIRENV